MLTKDYNLALIQVNIGAFRVTGWSADDACNVEKMGDDFQFDLSADGAHGAMSRINDNSRKVTLKLRRGSVGYKLVADAYTEQLRQSDVGAIGEVAFSIYDPLSGDKVSDRRMYFLNGPSMGFGKTAPEAEFVILLPNPTIVYGANIETSA